MKRVIIIGAGIGGLATANLLAKAGYQVTVYEKSQQPGGRAGIMRQGGFTFDTGPSWYLMPEVFEHYFSLLGTSTEQELELSRLSPAYKVFFEHNEPITITSDIDADAATFEAIEAGAGDKLRDYVKKGDAIYQLSLKHFLYTNFASLRDFLKPSVLRHGLTMARLALTPIDKYITGFVKDLRLRQILEYPMVFLGSSPFSAPALYSLMSALDFREGVFYPQGGIYTLIERITTLGQELGVRYEYNSPVRHITSRSGIATGIVLENGEEVMADIVISNADLHYTETKLLSRADQSYPQAYWDRHEAGPSALLMYLGVTGTLPHLEHHNLFFVNDWKQNFDDIFVHRVLPESASMYVCKPSATDPSVAPQGHENVFVLVPLPPGVSTGPDTETVADRYLSILAEKLSIPDLSDRLVVKNLFAPEDFYDSFHAWQNTALGPSHILRQSAFFRTPNKSKKLTNLYYVGGSTTPGIGLPMCLIGAELIYKRLTRDTRGGPVTEITPKESR